MILKNTNTTLLIVLLVFSASGTSAIVPTSPFDRFGDLNCEDEMAHLDNLAIQLQQEPASKAVITFYGGTMIRGRLPRRGEAAARAARMKPYLVNRRGIPSSRVTVVNGGFQQDWNVVVWVLAPGMSAPAPFPTIKPNQIKFRKGKVSPREFRCQI
jgi:hypothetical protein